MASERMVAASSGKATKTSRPRSQDNQKRAPSERRPDLRAPRDSRSRFVIIILAAVFLAAIAYVLVEYTHLFGKPLPNQINPDHSQGCTDGQTAPCSIGECTGIKTCRGGMFGTCKWDIVCASGTRVSCLNNSCVYAYKECNSCGSGYGPCIAPQ